VIRAVDRSLERVSSLVVGRGLFVLRYLSSSDNSGWPVAEIRCSAGSESGIKLISAPGARSNELSAPGACLVVLADSPGALQVTVRRRRPGDSLDAVLRLEPLGLAEQASEPEMSAPQSAPAAPPFEQAPSPPNFTILAHIARRGDVEVPAGTWAAGPSAPAQIEGLEIRASNNSEVGIEAQALIGGPRGGWTPRAAPGTYLGTRGRALPIMGVRFRLGETAPPGLALSAEAMFLGSPLLKKEGKEIELVGAFGADPLVGLRLSVIAAPAVERAPERSDNLSVAGTRVRIFRASAKASA
jgi:hypothetical protein